MTKERMVPPMDGHKSSLKSSTHYHNSLVPLIAEAEAIRQARAEVRSLSYGRGAQRTGSPGSATRRAAEDARRGRRAVLTVRRALQAGRDASPSTTLLPGLHLGPSAVPGNYDSGY